MTPKGLPGAVPQRDRDDRLDLSFPVEFRLGELRLRGSCQNLSASGMLARFNAPPELWTEGVLLCDAGVMTLELRVRVVRAEDREIGFMFQFRDERERAEVRLVVAFATQWTGIAGGRPPF